MTVEIAQQLSVADRIVIVTGGGGGIGAALAVGLAALGARVVATDVDERGLETTRGAAEAAAARVATRTTDVADEAAVASLFAWALAEHGRVDVVFSNAGIAGPLLPVDELPLADWRRVMAVNADGAFLVAREAVRAMKPAGRGKLVFTGSVWGSVAPRTAQLAAYTASKGAVANLVRRLAVELAPWNVTANGIAPAAVRTGIADGFYDNAEAVAGLLADVPLGRVVEPEELVGLAVFIASAASDFVTGQVIAFDGGYLAL
jgi:NAD(P)-dependent dehydrogenase (short-subunit alcohol dehydrogenase family)